MLHPNLAQNAPSSQLVPSLRSSMSLNNRVGLVLKEDLMPNSSKEDLDLLQLPVPSLLTKVFLNFAMFSIKYFFNCQSFLYGGIICPHPKILSVTL